MLVKIIKGTYGYRPDPNEVRIVRKDIQDPPFELNDKEAERIISLGVAQKCSSVPQKQEHINSIQPSSTDLSGITAEDIEAMEFNNLRKVAKAYGLDTKGSKEDLILRLKESLFPADDEPDNEADDNVDDSDTELPEFEAQEPVI